MKKTVEFIDIKCPQCGEKVLSHTKYDYLYGSPVRECPFCKTEVIDPFYHELATDGYRKDPRETKKLFKDVLLATVFTLVLAYFNLISFAIGNASFIMVVLMFIALSMIFIRIITFFTERKKNRQSLDKLKKESEARLADRAYAAKLAELGYKVPQQYL